MFLKLCLGEIYVSNFYGSFEVRTVVIITLLQGLAQEKIIISILSPLSKMFDLIWLVK